MIDLAAARDLFDNSTDFTVGVEEEFAIVDPSTLELVSKFEQLRDAAMADPILADAVAGELISSEIEIRSGIGCDLADSLKNQRERRQRLFKLAHENNVLLGATGTHPFSDYRDQQIINTPHYELVERQLQYVAWQNNTFAIHVHVGVKGANRAILVCDRLRSILPLLLAISANSPLLDGRNTGLRSVRSEIFTRMFPRCGIPDAFGSWDTWAEYVSILEQTNSIQEFTQIWWSVRPHHSFGTVEVRICDAQMTAEESNSLAALIVSCVKQAALEVDDGKLPAPIPHRLIEENMWRAIRYGLDGYLLDLEGPKVTEFPAAEVRERLQAWAGVEIEFPKLNGAQRQRQMLEDGATPFEVYTQCVRETQTTYLSEKKTGQTV